MPSPTIAASTPNHAAYRDYNLDMQRSARTAGTSTPSQEELAKAEIQQKFGERFSSLAADKPAFDKMMKEVYGENYDPAVAEGFRQAALKGDFSWLPPIEFKDAATLQGANGAYDSTNHVVYINESFIDDPSRAADVYLEETGHFMDTKLNTKDASGDEGELFRRLMLGENMSAADIAAVRAENDHGTLVVEGKEVDVEFWSLGGALKSVGNFVEDVGGAVVESVVGTVENTGESIADVGRAAEDFYHGNGWDGLKHLGLSQVKLVLQTPADSIIFLGAKTISAVQTLIGVETEGRKLTAEEIADLRTVYGDSIDYDKIEVKEGDVGLIGVGDRTRTVGNTIYVAKGDLPLTRDTLVHETGHVWQYQNGGTDYLSEALIGRLPWIGEGGDEASYDFKPGVKEAKPWSDFNPEQQAALIEEAHRQGCFGVPPKPFKIEGVDYTDYLNGVMKQVRNGEGTG